MISAVSHEDHNTDQGRLVTDQGLFRPMTGYGQFVPLPPFPPLLYDKVIVIVLNITIVIFIIIMINDEDAGEEGVWFSEAGAEVRGGHGDHQWHWPGYSSWGRYMMMMMMKPIYDADDKVWAGARWGEQGGEPAQKQRRYDFTPTGDPTMPRSFCWSSLQSFWWRTMLLICLMMDLTIDHSESLMMVTILKAQRQPRYDSTSCDDDDDEIE